MAEERVQGSDDSPLMHTLGRRAVRYKRVLISCFLLQQLVTQDSRSEDFPWGSRCIEGVPPDARLVHSSVEWQGSAPILALVFEHAPWPEVPEGHETPILTPVFAQERRSPQAGGSEAGGASGSEALPRPKAGEQAQRSDALEEHAQPAAGADQPQAPPLPGTPAPADQ